LVFQGRTILHWNGGKTGSSIFKADANGIYLGSSSFSSAPFRVTPNGEFTATNATLTNANISGNITMTGGSISWSSVAKPLYTAAEVGARPISWTPTAGDVGALARNSPMLTNITQTGIYTGTINANQINAGKINAAYIDVENLTAARISQKGSPNNYAVLGGNYGDLELHHNGRNYFTIYNDIGAVTLQHYGKSYLSFSDVLKKVIPHGAWDFSGASVQGLNVVARFG